MMKKILVTGSEGYIGQHLVELLVSSGHKVFGCDPCWYDEAFITEKVQGYELFKCDFSDLSEAELVGFDAVCHLAAISNDPMGDLDPDITLSINQHKTISFAERCARSGVGMFLFSSSCSVYGEAVSELVDEQSDLNPVSLYAETKVEVENALLELGKNGFVTASLRNATAFGHSLNLRLDLVINDFVDTALTTGSINMLSNGEAHRPLVHCRDIAAAFMRLCESPTNKVKDLVVNFGPQNANLKVIQMAKETQKVLENCEISIGDDAGKDTRDYSVDFKKWNSLFPNFKFCYSLNEGIIKLKQTLENFRFCENDRTSGRFKRLHLLKKALDS